MYVNLLYDGDELRSKLLIVWFYNNYYILKNQVGAIYQMIFNKEKYCYIFYRILEILHFKPVIKIIRTIYRFDKNASTLYN